MVMLINPYAFGAGSPPTGIGGIDANTVLMLHMNGSDASTTFTDDSASAHTVTANGNAQIDTAQDKFGSASGLFDGTGDYLTVPTSTDFNIGTGDFCIDFWIRFNGSSTFGASYFPFIVGSRSSDSNRWFVNFNPNDTLGRGCGLSIVVGGVLTETSESTQPSYNTFHHYAITRSGGTVRIYRNGVLTASGTNSDSFVANQTLNIAYRGTDTAAGYLNGHLDEFRISKGDARIDNENDPLYCGGDPANGFTPPASEYTS